MRLSPLALGAVETGSSSQINGSPMHMEERELDLSILRTCKQLYNEGKYILWQHNSLCIESPPQLFRFEAVGWHTSPFRDVKHVIVKFGISYPWSSCEGSRIKYIQALADWAKAARLKTITLLPVPSSLNQELHRIARKDVIKDAGDSDESLPVYLSLLKYASEETYLSQIERRLVVYFKFLGEKRGMYEHDALSICAVDPNTVLKKMHEAFGGELWVESGLCFKNGLQIEAPTKFYGYARPVAKPSPDSRYHQAPIDSSE